jgi:cytochrome P450
MLLQATYDDGSLMTDEQLRDEMTTILGAGHETTASALAWAMERILRTPRVLAKLRGSLAEGNDEYMAATVKEALRIRPVLISVVRKLNSPLEIGGYELPTGTFVTPAISALHHNEEIFPRPWEFRPERFLEENVDSYAWLPFGGGVRRCAGAAFAEYEMRIIIGEMVRRADLSVNPRSERVTARNITLRPSRGTRVVLNHPLRDNLGTT